MFININIRPLKATLPADHKRVKRSGSQACNGLELQKGQQHPVPLPGKMGKIGTAQLLGDAPRNRSVELIVKGYIAQVAPPAFDRRPQML